MSVQTQITSSNSCIEERSSYIYPSCEAKIRSMQCTSCGFIKVFQVDCGNRLCLSCSQKRAKRLFARYMPLVKLYKQPALLTLTICRQTRLNYHKIRRQFRVFRHYWTKMNIKNGLYVIETKQKTDGWHTHIHAIIDSSYYPQAQISDEWKQSTDGDSFIVHIQRVDTMSALSYLLKYLGKTATIRTKSGADEYLNATHGTRLVQTFGKRYGEIVKKPIFHCPNCKSTEWSYFVDVNFSCTPLKPEKPPGKYKNEDETYAKSTTKERNVYDLALSRVWY